jgi:hypothetical protein
MLDRMHFARDPTQRVDQLPCGWHSTHGKCRDGALGKCAKCKHNAAPDPAVLSRAKAACTVDFLAKLPAGSLVVQAA